MLVLLGKGLYHYLKEVCVDLGGQDVGWTVTSAGSVCLTSTRRCSFPPHAVKNVSLWRTGPLLWQYYPSFLPFRNVTLEQTWKQHCCASAEPLFLKSQSQNYSLQVNVELHVASFFYSWTICQLHKCCSLKIKCCVCCLDAQICSCLLVEDLSNSNKCPAKLAETMTKMLIWRKTRLCSLLTLVRFGSERSACVCLLGLFGRWYEPLET